VATTQVNAFWAFYSWSLTERLSLTAIAVLLHLEAALPAGVSEHIQVGGLQAKHTLGQSGKSALYGQVISVRHKGDDSSEIELGYTFPIATRNTGRLYAVRGLTSGWEFTTVGFDIKFPF